MPQSNQLSAAWSPRGWAPDDPVPPPGRIGSALRLGGCRPCCSALRSSGNPYSSAARCTYDAVASSSVTHATTPRQPGPRSTGPYAPEPTRTLSGQAFGHHPVSAGRQHGPLGFRQGSLSVRRRTLPPVDGRFGAPLTTQ